jgi:hypothetical protein
MTATSPKGLRSSKFPEESKANQAKSNLGIEAILFLQNITELVPLKIENTGSLSSICFLLMRRFVFLMMYLRFLSLRDKMANRALPRESQYLFLGGEADA